MGSNEHRGAVGLEGQGSATLGFGILSFVISLSMLGNLLICGLPVMGCERVW